MSVPESEYVPTSAPDADDDWTADPADERSAAREHEHPDRADYDGQQLDREERQSLRRVAGMSTELTDITDHGGWRRYRGLPDPDSTSAS